MDLIILAPGRRGCATNPVRDLAALVVLEERGVPEALSAAGSAGRKGAAYVMPISRLVLSYIFLST